METLGALPSHSKQHNVAALSRWKVLVENKSGTEEVLRCCCMCQARESLVMSLKHQGCSSGLVRRKSWSLKKRHIKIGKKEVLQKAMFQPIVHHAFFCLFVLNGKTFLSFVLPLAKQ